MQQKWHRIQIDTILGITNWNTAAKLTFTPLKIHKKKFENVEKTSFIKMNKASFETKACQDNRMRNKHLRIMYPAVTKPKIPGQKPFKPKNNPQDSNS